MRIRFFYICLRSTCILFLLFVQQDKSSMRMAPTSAKPPLPRSNRNSASISRRSSDKDASPRRRSRPPTSRNTSHWFIDLPVKPHLLLMDQHGCGLLWCTTKDLIGVDSFSCVPAEAKACNLIWWCPGGAVICLATETHLSDRLTGQWNFVSSSLIYVDAIHCGMEGRIGLVSLVSAIYQLKWSSVWKCCLKEVALGTVVIDKGRCAAGNQWRQCVSAELLPGLRSEV